MRVSKIAADNQNDSFRGLIKDVPHVETEIYKLRHHVHRMIVSTVGNPKDDNLWLEFCWKKRVGKNLPPANRQWHAVSESQYASQALLMFKLLH
mmetsp:Transcript_693/g.931  ORF Transcript_693/g.931 Transcript_693/m.931 type:complete len:94 (+) Transcript_693:233-514(+)